MPATIEPTDELREANSPRWEHVSGRALKAWVTAVMTQNNLTRAQAREFVLDHINEEATA